MNDPVHARPARAAVCGTGIYWNDGYEDMLTMSTTDVSNTTLAGVFLGQSSLLDTCNIFSNQGGARP